jgi:hypothetical protein
LRQWESRYAIRAGRNFVVIPSFEGDRLCLHLCEADDPNDGTSPSSAESPRIAPAIDLSRTDNSSEV